ncbi:MAG TPA: tetratricopeptide repeat protein [Syntrophales bacterium]|nr:tetratricopeptide repeat protein [Syntrophales bacterium]
MARKITWYIGAAFLAIAFLAGCQTMLTHVKATRAMQEGRYEESISLFREVLKKNENNVEALKGLGETYLRMKKTPEAVAVLEKAHRLAPEDKVAGVNLGVAYNMNEQYDKAVQLWRPYVEKEPASNLSAVIRRQITLALYRDAAKKAKEAVKQEALLQAAPGEPNALAVTYFSDKGLTQQSKPLQKAMAAMLITDLSKTKSLKVVERIRLQKLLEEMQLGTSGLVDDGTAPRVGRLLGAGKVVTGNMIGEGDKVDVKRLLMNVPTGGEVGRQDANGLVKEFFKIEKAVAFGILKDMGVQLSKEEEATIGRYASQSYPGLIYYGEGLDAQDRGEWDKAIAIFQKCLKEDPTGPCAAALLEAPSGDDAEASFDVGTMGNAVGVAAANDAAAAADSSGGGGGG